METNILKLLLQNVAFANIGDAGGLQPSAGAGSLYVSLHTADPGDAGDQTTNESAYTSYARVAVARSALKWDVTDDTGSNIDAVDFPACTGGSSTVTHFGVGTAASGAGHLLLSGALTSSITITAPWAPSFAAGQLEVTAA
jgi:hypothetical protein